MWFKMQSQPSQQQVLNRQMPIVPQGMSAETDKVFRKWLKLQISTIYVNMFMRLLMLILIGGSVVFSAFTLAPIVESQLGVLQKMMGTVGGLYGFTAPSNSTSISGGETAKSGSDSSQVFDIINKLSEEQKKQMIEMLEN